MFTLGNTEKAGNRNRNVEMAVFRMAAQSSPTYDELPRFPEFSLPHGLSRFQHRCQNEVNIPTGSTLHEWGNYENGGILDIGEFSPSDHFKFYSLITTFHSFQLCITTAPIVMSSPLVPWMPVATKLSTNQSFQHNDMQHEEIPYREEGNRIFLHSQSWR